MLEVFWSWVHSDCVKTIKYQTDLIIQNNISNKDNQITIQKLDEQCREYIDLSETQKDTIKELTERALLAESIIGKGGLPDIINTEVVTDGLTFQGKYSVPNQNITFESDVRDFITPTNRRVQKETLNVVRSISTVTGLDSVAYALYSNICSRHKYEQDLTNLLHPDFWLYPEQALQISEMDCEDSSLALISMMLFAGIPRDRVVCGLGGWNGIGHVWVCYKDDNKVWRIFETTKKQAEPWSQVPSLSSMTNYVPQYFFNDRDVLERKL